jgi:hypothetical protein
MVTLEVCHISMAARQLAVQEILSNSINNDLVPLDNQTKHQYIQLAKDRNVTY